MDQNTQGKTYAAFIGVVVIGGGNFIAVSMSNMELPPLYGATLRFALAAVIFLVIGVAARVSHARGRKAAGAALYGILGFGATYALLYYALVGLPAGTVAVIVAATPLFTLAVAVLLRQERLSGKALAGGGLAMAGISILSLDSFAVGLSPSFLIAALFGTVASSIASVIARALRDVHPVSMNAIGMSAGAGVLALGSYLFRETWLVPGLSRTWLALGWLVLLGSVGLFQLFLYVIKRWTASATVYAIAAMPVVAASLGVMMLNQPLTARFLAGGSLVFAAVYIGAISPKKAES